MTWLSANWPLVVEYTIRHLALAVPATLVSVLVAVPLGLLAQRRPRLGGPLLTVAGLLYTLPSLPLLVVIPAIVGTQLRSPATMIIALAVYGTALLVRSAADAFGSVPRHVRQAAIATGMTPGRTFWGVDLPLALPVLIPGIRVMTVSTVSLVTIGALVGIHGLGSLLTDGFQRGILAEVVTGVLGTVLLALLLDGLWWLIGRLATPWLRTQRTQRTERLAGAGHAATGRLAVDPGAEQVAPGAEPAHGETGRP